MKLRASEFISKAEGLKSSELSIRQKLEGIRSRRSSIQSEISTLEYRLDSLYIQLEALESSDSDDEDGADNSGSIATVMAEISSTQDDISDCRQQDAELRSQEMEADAELRQIEMEEQETLSDIQDSAARTNQNIALISSFGGDYANVSAKASGSFQHNLGQLSQAAQILGGSVAMGVAGAGGRSAGRVSRGNAGQADGSGRNFYEAANNQRKSGSSSSGVMGSRGNGGSSGVRKALNLYSTQDDIDDRTPKKGGIGKRIANAFSGLMEKKNGSDSADFSGFIARPRDPLERELDADLPSSNAKKFGGIGAKEQQPNSTNGVRNQLLNTEITRKMEKVHDFKLRTQAHDYRKREQYSKEKWDTLSVDQKKDSLTAMVSDLNRLLGTNISSDIEFYHDASKRSSRGQYIHGEKKVWINECYLIGDTSWRIYQTVIHEMRHAYQHYAVENPDKVNVSKETIAKWKENFENYKSTKNGFSFEEYINQPIEWDAKNFANQVTDLVGSNPEYPGSWSESELEEEA